MKSDQVAVVLVRTLPVSAGNYGGILQAFALQRVLESLGLNPVTDSTPLTAVHRSFTTNVKLLVKKTAFRLGIPGLLKPDWVRNELRFALDRSLADFVAQYVPQVRLYGEASRPDPVLLATFDGFLVGSDQVWRAKWSDVASYLLDFLDPGDARPRVAYAASFGRDDIAEYNGELRLKSRELAQRLTDVSVRERSGIDICKREWGVDAEHHVDPTLLLHPGCYARLAASSTPYASGNNVVSYVLDENPGVARQIQQVAMQLGAPAVSLVPDVPRSWREFRLSREQFARPRVEQWLGAIAAARFVVTDSFHGTVFALLNNVPFVAIANRTRGASRFESLLETFGLEERLIEPGGKVPTSILSNTIDWAYVNERIELERERGVQYLRRAFADLIEAGAGRTPT